jgi:hypothetical protein
MFVRLKKHRPYQYEPRFYTPDKDSKARKQIRFRRPRRKGNALSMVFIITAIALILYVLHLLSKLIN